MEKFEIRTILKKGKKSIILKINNGAIRITFSYYFAE